MTAQQRASALRMIAAKGQTVSIAGVTAQAYNPTTGAVTDTPYSASAKAVLLPLASYRKFGQSTLVAGDETMLLAAEDTSGAVMADPPVDAVVTLADGSKRTLIAVDPLEPAGLTIFYDCVVRGHA